MTRSLRFQPTFLHYLVTLILPLFIDYYLFLKGKYSGYLEVHSIDCKCHFSNISVYFEVLRENFVGIHFLASDIINQDRRGGALR